MRSSDIASNRMNHSGQSNAPQSEQPVTTTAPSTNPTAPEDMVAPHSGNGYAMRENIIKKGLGRTKPDLEQALAGAASKAAAE